MFNDCVDKLVGFLAPVGWTVAAAGASAGPAWIEPVTGTVVAATVLALHLKQRGEERCSIALKRALKDIAADLDSGVARQEYSADDRILIKQGLDGLAAFLGRYRPNYQQLVRDWSIDPAQIGPAILTDADKSGAFRDSAEGKRWAGHCIDAAVRTIANDPELFAKLAPEVARTQLLALKGIERTLAEVLARTDEISAATRDVRRLVDSLPEAVRRNLDEGIRKALAQQQEVASDRARVVLYSLAYRINRNVDNLELAERELAAAVDLLLEDTRQQNTSNFGTMIDQALARVSALSLDARYDEAAEAARAAFERWQSAEESRKRDEEERQEASRLAGLTLLEAALRQYQLARDAYGTARITVEMTRLLCEPPEIATKIRAEYLRWYDAKEDDGRAFDVEVSAELARLAASLPSSSRERAEAYHHSGLAMMELGQRDTGNRKLEAAIDAFNLSLEVFEGEDRWDPTINLAGAAFKLAERRGDEHEMARAVTTLNSVAEEMSPETSPHDRAFVLVYLGAGLLRLGEHRRDRSALKESIAALRTVLDTPIGDNNTTFVANAMTILGVALRTLGNWEKNTSMLEEAATTQNYALASIDRLKNPLQWGIIQINLGDVAILIYDMTSDQNWRDLALESTQAAVRMFTELQIPYYLAIAEKNLEKLSALAASKA